MDRLFPESAPDFGRFSRLSRDDGFRVEAAKRIASLVPDRCALGVSASSTVVAAAHEILRQGKCRELVTNSLLCLPELSSITVHILAGTTDQKYQATFCVPPDNMNVPPLDAAIIGACDVSEGWVRIRLEQQLPIDRALISAAKAVIFIVSPRDSGQSFPLVSLEKLAGPSKRIVFVIPCAIASRIGDEVASCLPHGEVISI